MATHNQYTMQNPLTQYPQPQFPKQPQSAPGTVHELQPAADHGETSYKGFGRLAGRRALITGADSGIGRAAAIAFAREGADIVLNYLPEEEADAREVVKLIEAEGRKAVSVPGDLTDERFCQSLVSKAVAGLGGLDILVNVAGKQTAQQDIAELTTEQFDATFKTNVYALFWLCKAALPHLPAGATIINTASIQAYQPSATLLDYAPTKSAIVAFTKALAKQVIGKVSASMPWPLAPSGRRCSPAVASRRTRSPTSAPKPRWAAPANRPNARLSMCCWPARNRATSPAKCLA